jgi:hypothetical protein
MTIWSVLFIDSSGLVIPNSVLWKTLSGTPSSESSEDDEDALDSEEDNVDRLVELGLAVVALLNVADTS